MEVFEQPGSACWRVSEVRSVSVTSSVTVIRPLTPFFTLSITSRVYSIYNFIAIAVVIGHCTGPLKRHSHSWRRFKAHPPARAILQTEYQYTSV